MAPLDGSLVGGMTHACDGPLRDPQRGFDLVAACRRHQFVKLSHHPCSLLSDKFGRFSISGAEQVQAEKFTQVVDILGFSFKRCLLFG